jgi:hypothetical protein
MSDFPRRIREYVGQLGELLDDYDREILRERDESTQGRRRSYTFFDYGPQVASAGSPGRDPRKPDPTFEHLFTIGRALTPTGYVYGEEGTLVWDGRPVPGVVIVRGPLSDTDP